MQAKAKILVVRDIERDDIEFISKTLGCLPIADSEGMRPEKLGHAALVAETPVRLPCDDMTSCDHPCWLDMTQLLCVSPVAEAAP